MYIVNQERTVIYNLEKFQELSLSGRQILLADGSVSNGMMRYVLGTYSTPERAQEVFKVLLDRWFSFDGGKDKRYMPEK